MDTDDYHELDQRITELHRRVDGHTRTCLTHADLIHRLEQGLKDEQDARQFFGRHLREQREQIQQLSEKLEQTILTIHQLIQIVEVMNAGFAQDLKPTSAQRDQLDVLAMRLRGASWEDIRQAKLLAEIKSLIEMGRLVEDFQTQSEEAAQE